MFGSKPLRPVADVNRPSARAMLRPFGYLSVTVLWFVIFLIAVGLAFSLWVVPP